MTTPTSSSGSFFAVDRRTWAKICDPLEMNEAVAYLVLACGTGRDNLITSWSSQALQAGVCYGETGQIPIADSVPDIMHSAILSW